MMRCPKGLAEWVKLVDQLSAIKNMKASMLELFLAAANLTKSPASKNEALKNLRRIIVNSLR